MQWAKEVWNDKFQRYLLLGLIILGLLLVFFPQQQQPVQDDADMVFFYLPTCPHCHEQQDFHEILLEENPALTIKAIDVSAGDGQAQYMDTLTMLGDTPKTISVPVTIINGSIIKGFESANTTGEAIRRALAGEEVSIAPIDCSTESDCEADLALSILGFDFTINPAKYSLPVLALLLGFVDGFNPCAMWVLVYLISLVVMLKDRRRAWLLIGIFLAASGILYFLFMTAWLNVFLFIGFLRPVQILIGLFALGAGILSLKSWWKGRKEGLTCDVGDLASKRKTMSRAHEIINAPLTIATIGGMILLAFVVNSIEFMCSFGIPAVFSQVLAVAPISTGYQYGMIALYVLMYMIDDMVIFGLAVFAVEKTLGDKYALHCRWIAGGLLLVLGIILLFFPQVLASLG